MITKKLSQKYFFIMKKKYFQNVENFGDFEKSKNRKFRKINILKNLKISDVLFRCDVLFGHVDTGRKGELARLSGLWVILGSATYDFAENFADFFSSIFFREILLENFLE